MNGLPPPGMMPPGPMGQQPPAMSSAPLPINQVPPQTQPGQEPPLPPDVFDLTAGKYDLVVQAGPSYTTRREETAAALTDAIRSFPQGASALLPLLLDTLDVPGIDKIKAHIEQLAAQSANSPEQMKQQAEAQKLMAENAALKNQLALEKAQAAADKQIAAMQKQVAAAQAELDSQQAALKVQQTEAQSAMEKAMGGLEQQKLAIEQQNADTARIKADADLISAKTAAAPLGITETSESPDLAKLISAAIKEAMSLMPAPVFTMRPQPMRRTLVRDPKTGLALHSIDEPIPDGTTVN